MVEPGDEAQRQALRNRALHASELDDRFTFEDALRVTLELVKWGAPTADILNWALDATIVSGNLLAMRNIAASDLRDGRTFGEMAKEIAEGFESFTAPEPMITKTRLDDGRVKTVTERPGKSVMTTFSPAPVGNARTITVEPDGRVVIDLGEAS